MKTEKQNERANRKTFDVKELQLKFKGYKQKDDILNMIMRKMSIDSKINQYLVKGSIVFDFSILFKTCCKPGKFSPKIYA